METHKVGKTVECRVVEDFRLQLKKNKNALDLGCRVFRFDEVAKKRG